MSIPLDVAPSDGRAARLTLKRDQLGATIHPNVHGQFAEHLGRGIYEGIWVGEGSSLPNVRGLRCDVIEALQKLRVPVLRWPGGCFADEYHWKDGVGPREGRPRRLNTHWGGVIENNHFGTHEFIDLCEQIGAAPYICGNVGSGTVQEMMEWVEYMTSAGSTPMADWRRQNGRAEPWEVPYFGVGNESWGCGGSMRSEYYADNYRRYATFVKNHGPKRIQRIACGSNGFDYAWTETLMKAARGNMDGLSLHWYSLPTGQWSRKGAATAFDEREWHSTLVQALRMEELVSGHAAIMDRYDPERRVGLVVDEWGTWYDVEPGTNPGFLYQQSTLRDALVAALTLNVFHHHCDRVTMANIAQTVNVLQAVILTENERMIVTPTYHAFEMYNVHQNASLVPLELDAAPYEQNGVTLPSLHASASRNAAGKLHLSLVHLDPNRSIELGVRGLGASVSGRVLTAPAIDTHNTFDRPDAVVPAAFDAFRRGRDETTWLTLPPKSVVVLAAD